MEIKTKTSFWQSNKLNIFLAFAIMIVTVFIVAGLNNKSVQKLKSSLISSYTEDIDLSAGKSGSDVLELLWTDDQSLNGNANFYTGEVLYQVKYYTGELTTSQMVEEWNQFDDIRYDEPGIRLNGSTEKRITATDLDPDTRYTFGVVRDDLHGANQHISNALVASTLASSDSSASFAGSANTNHNTNASSSSSQQVEKGDVNRDQAITTNDSYAVVMYLYFNNWPAYLVAMQNQGVFEDIGMTEKQFKSWADADGNCTVDFSDAGLVAQKANGALEDFPESGAEQCTY